MTIIHFEIHCAACGLPMLLPADTLQQPFAFPETKPNDSLCVGVVCHRCKNAERYFLHQKHPQHNPKDRAWAVDSRIEETVLVSILECDVEPCSSRLPLFAQWKAATIEEERITDMSTWKWDHLQCSGGHAIPKPKNFP